MGLDKYPLGDPQGTPRQKLLWKLGFRLVPTRAERVLGVILMAAGLAIMLTAVRGLLG